YIVRVAEFSRALLVGSRFCSQSGVSCSQPGEIYLPDWEPACTGKSQSGDFPFPTGSNLLPTGSKTCSQPGELSKIRRLTHCPLNLPNVKSTYLPRIYLSF